jgi:hypothetical protein
MQKLSDLVESVGEAWPSWYSSNNTPHSQLLCKMKKNWTEELKRRHPQKVPLLCTVSYNIGHLKTSQGFKYFSQGRKTKWRSIEDDVIRDLNNLYWRVLWSFMASFMEFYGEFFPFFTSLASLLPRHTSLPFKRPSADDSQRHSCNLMTFCDG